MKHLCATIVMTMLEVLQQLIVNVSFSYVVTMFYLAA